MLLKINWVLQLHRLFALLDILLGHHDSGGGGGGVKVL